MSEEEKISKAKVLKDIATATVVAAVADNRPLRFYREKWFRYTGQKYQPIDDVDIWLLKNVASVHSSRDRREIELNMRAACFVPSALDMPAFLGGRKDSVIPFANGLFSVATWKLEAHTPDYFCSFVLPFAFDPAVECKAWLQMLNCQLDDAEDVACLQEWFGYCLTQDVRFQKYMTLVGVPSSGKSTVNHVLSLLVGKENTIGYDMVRLGERFGLQQLVGKQLATLGEVELKGVSEKSQILARLKSITGNDPVGSEFKYSNAIYNTILPIKISIACNELPAFYDDSGALNRRMLVLEFIKPILAAKPNWINENVLPEIEGVANWALAGLKRLIANGGFTESAKMMARLSVIRRESSPVLGFVQDCLVVEAKYAPRAKEMNITTTDQPLGLDLKHLTALHTLWCSENGHEATNMRWVGRNLRQLLPQIPDSCLKKMDGKVVRMQPGITGRSR